MKRCTCLIVLLAAGVTAGAWRAEATETVYSAPAAKKSPRLASAKQVVWPRSLRHGLPDAPVDVRLPPLDAATVRSESAKALATGKGLPVGIVRSLSTGAASSAAERASGNWTELPDGGRVWRWVIEAPGAVGVRIHLAGLALPESCEIFAYDAFDPTRSRGPYVAAAIGARSEFWVGTVFSERVSLEIYVPASAPAKDLAVSVNRVVHLFRGPFAAPKAGSCHVDVNCRSNWANVADAVGGLLIVSGGFGYWCTGCLLNDQDPSTFVDYFMTANHCVANQAEASSTEYYWFFQTDECNGTVPDVDLVPLTAGGADYLAGQAWPFGNDFAFLRLRSEPPAGVTYAGWTTAAPDASALVTCIHHPDGAYKRISQGVGVGFNNNYWNVQWTSGVTEPGSSGSPLFIDDQRFIGQLYGGFSSCSLPRGIDDFGRFSVSFPVIQQWLTGENPGCQDWPCLYAILFDDPGQVKRFRQFRDTLLRDDPMGKAATLYLYQQSEAALTLFAADPDLARRAGAVATENKDALDAALRGDVGIVPNTWSILLLLREMEQRAPSDLAGLARTTRFLLAWKLLTGEDFLGMRFEQWPWIRSGG